jgi:hypothetical protein
MIKSKLENGTPMLVIKVEHFVKCGDFATALTDYYYNKSEPFNKKLKRREAMEILNHRLFFYGLNGEYDAGFFEASFELGEERKLIYEPAREWVIKNYPHLEQSDSNDR